MIETNPSQSQPKDDKAPEKKDMKNVCSFLPNEFNYNQTLGEGAFGKVRKCEFEYKESAPKINPENPEASDKIISPEILARKKTFSENDHKVMAVKI